MADTAGQALIRGIDVDKISKDYLDESLVFKNLVTNMTTSSREIRWYQKTSGFLTATTPEAIGAVAEGALPFVLEQSWTRNTSYVKKYFLESPTITMEDESDNDVQILLKNSQDVAQAVAYEVDGDIWDVLTESQSPVNINSVTATAAWDASSGQDPFEDIAEAKQKIREQTKRRLVDGSLLVSAKGEKDLMVWLVSNKGVNFNQVAGAVLENGVLTTVAGLNVVVSENVTADYAAVGDLKQACEYREFMPFTTRIIEEVGIGKKIRSWHHGIALLVRPKFMALISNTEA